METDTTTKKIAGYTIHAGPMRIAGYRGRPYTGYDVTDPKGVRRNVTRETVEKAAAMEKYKAYCAKLPPGTKVTYRSPSLYCMVKAVVVKAGNGGVVVERDVVAGNITETIWGMD